MYLFLSPSSQFCILSIWFSTHCCQGMYGYYIKSLKLYCPRSQLVQLHHVKSGTQIIERILYIIFCFWEQFYITLRPPWGQDIEIVRTLNVESGRIKCRGQCKVSLLDRLSTFIQNFYQFQGKAEEQSSDEMRYLYKKSGGKG